MTTPARSRSLTPWRCQLLAALAAAAGCAVALGQPTPLPAVVPIASIDVLSNLPPIYFLSAARDGLRVSSDGAAILATLTNVRRTDGLTSPFDYVLRTTAGADVVNDVRTKIPFLPPAELVFSQQGGAISGDGRVVVGTYSHTYQAGGNQDPLGFPIRSFRWSEADGLQELAFPGPMPGGLDVLGLSDDGQTAVGHYLNGASSSGVAAPFQAVKWDAQGNPTPLGLIDGASFPISRAIDASADGSLIVGWGFGPRPGSPRTQWFRWSADSGIVPVPNLVDGWNGMAVAVTPDGRAVLGVEESGNLLDVLNQDQTPKNARPWVWTPDGGYTEIPIIDDPRAQARDYGGASAITADGRAVFGAFLTETDAIAYVWDRVHGTRDLREVLINEHGVDLTVYPKIYGIDSVSSDGRVLVGRGEVDGVSDQPCTLYPGVPVVPNISNLPGDPLPPPHPGAPPMPPMFDYCQRLTGQMTFAIYLERPFSSTPCPADADGDGAATADDIFAFLNRWFASDPRADMNADGAVSADDIFVFLAGWFEGC